MAQHTCGSYCSSSGTCYCPSQNNALVPCYSCVVIVRPTGQPSAIPSKPSRLPSYFPTPNAAHVDAPTVDTQVHAVFNFTGHVQTFTVPYCVHTIDLFVVGGSGGGSRQSDFVLDGGFGGTVATTLRVTPLSSLSIYIGQKPPTKQSTGYYTPVITGGYNGGGHGGTLYGGAGGGATDVRIGGNDLSNRVVVAGGGGGVSMNFGKKGTYELPLHFNVHLILFLCLCLCHIVFLLVPVLATAGDGGYPSGGTVDTSATYGFAPPTGGNQVSGGIAGYLYANGQDSGQPGALGIGGDAAVYGGGGGGGYYGGGGGAASGAGGSSYCDSSLCSNMVYGVTSMQRNGSLVISYVPCPSSAPSSSTSSGSGGGTASPSFVPTTPSTVLPSRNPTLTPTVSPTTVSPAPIGCAAGMYSMSMTTPQTPMCAVCPAGTFSAYAAFLCTACADGKCRFKVDVAICQFVILYVLFLHSFSNSIRLYSKHTLSTYFSNTLYPCIQALCLGLDHRNAPFVLLDTSPSRV